MITKWQDINIVGAGTYAQSTHHYLNSDVYGTANLAGGTFSITYAGAQEGFEDMFFYRGALTNATLDIYGLSVPTIYNSKKFIGYSRFDGAAWQNYILPDFSQSDIIQTAHMINLAVTTAKINDYAVTLAKMEKRTAGSLIVGAGATDCVELAASTAGKILQLNATPTPSWITLSSDITIAVGGAVTIANSAITSVKLSTAVAGNGLTGGGGAALSVKPSAAGSMAVAAAGVALVNDELAPAVGSPSFYGYVGAVKGWFGASSMGVTLQNAYDNGDTITIGAADPTISLVNNNNVVPTLTFSGTSTEPFIFSNTVDANYYKIYISKTSSGLVNSASFNFFSSTVTASTDNVGEFLSFCSNKVHVDGSKASTIGFDSSFTTFPGVTFTASNHYHFRAQDPTSNTTLNNAGVSFYGYYYSSTPTAHTNGNRYGAYFSFTRVPAAGDVFGLYLTGTTTVDLRLSNGAIIHNTSATQLTITETNIVNRGVIGRTQGTPTSETGACTLTAAKLLTGIIEGTPTTGGTRVYTLDTGANMDAALSSYVVNDSFDFSIINLQANAATDTITLTSPGADFTIVGNPIIESAHAGRLEGSQGLFRARKTGVATWICYRIG